MPTDSGSVRENRAPTCNNYDDSNCPTSASSAAQLPDRKRTDVRAHCSQQRLFPESKPYDRKNRLHPILPGDLLPLLIRPPVIRHAHLKDPNPRPKLGDLRRNLRLKTKSITLECDSIQYRLAEHLVTNFHVRQVQIGEHVAERRQHLVPQCVPVIKHTMRLAPHKARSKYHICLVINQRL